jgi:hypothetical protein
MLDFDLLVDISKKLHKALGTETQFEKKASELDLLNLFKMKELKIKNSEGFYNLLEQKRISDLKFASFDEDPKRKRNFLVHSLNMLEEAIQITKDDKSFNPNKKILLYLNYLRILKILLYQVNPAVKKNIFQEMINVLNTIDTDILFLKSWFLFFQAQIFKEIGEFDKAKNTLYQAKKLYFENFSDFYFTFQSDFGKNYWDEFALRLESELK